MRFAATAPKVWRHGAALLGAAALLWSFGLGQPVSAAGGPTFRAGIPTTVDPIRGVGEPDIAVDGSNDAWITGPAGTGTQTSFFWHSRDGGLTYPLIGPSGGHWVCPATGGGDSLVLVDHANNQVYVWDQEALLSVGIGRTDRNGSSLSSTCLSTPAMTADRPFGTVLHPNGAVKAPQFGAAGNHPVAFMSWQCNGCQGGNPLGEGGGLAYAWSTDGKTWHAADPGVPADTLVTDQLDESNAISSYDWHGNMAVDPVTGYVFTALSCSGGSCPCPQDAVTFCADQPQDKEFGVAVGRPACAAGPNCPHPAAVNGYGGAGQFASMTYQTASNTYQGNPWAEDGSLFPVIAMDSHRTLYEAWIDGHGATASGTAPAEAWHLYYTYSKDLPDHKVWSPVQRIDVGGGTSVMGWIAAGDAGKLAAVWLNTPVRERPSDTSANENRPWNPHMAISVDADTPHASWQESKVGIGPNHVGDICLQGTTCGVPQNGARPGNRNMADFISIDIGADGAAQATWASDANELTTLPTTQIPGVPLTETARQVAGPRLIGSGSIDDRRFSAAAVHSMSDLTGDALYPVWPRTGSTAGHNVPQLDLTGSKVEWDGSNIVVHVPVASLSSLASPDTSCQTNVWWLTTWQQNGRIYFAKAESDSGGAPRFTAGAPSSFDRLGIGAATFPTLVDYSGGTAVTGSKQGDEWVLRVPPSVVGSPARGSTLEGVTAYTVLDDGLPLTIGPGTGAPCEPQDNIPTVVDAAAAFNSALVPTSVAGVSTNPFTAAAGSPAPWVPIGLAIAGGAALIAGGLRRRRRAR